MKIGFHCNQLSIRGTEVAMYDYAHYNETLLGNKSIVISKSPDIWKYSDAKAIEKFEKRFDVFFYKSNDELQSIIKDNNLDIFYAQKAGLVDDVVSKHCKTVVHAVFQYEQPHGNVYAYISEWLSNVYGNRHPFVSYMATIPDNNENLREQLGIPTDAIVFGRHGGYETFDIEYAKLAVTKVAKNSNTYFLFMNTEPFTNHEYKNVIYLDSTADPIEKVKFINTCDAMLHARHKGESFGLAIAEFSLRNKPILTCKSAVDKAHFSILGSNALYYNSVDELMNLLKEPKYLNPSKDWNMYREYSPEKIMEKFKKIFID
jgi:hypothetical protein